MASSMLSAVLISLTFSAAFSVSASICLRSLSQHYKTSGNTTPVLHMVPKELSVANFQSYLKDIKNQIKETDVPALSKDRNGAVLIDVREQDEYVQGYIPGARWIPRGFLESRIEDAVPDKSTPVVLYCAGGTRSALSARALGELGYTNV